MPRRRPILAAALLVASFLSQAAGASADTLRMRSALAPDRLGASTNLSLLASLGASDALAPPPVKRFTLYAPAGLLVDTRGTGTCALATLQQRGPTACPANSRAGFGGGVGVLELPDETVRETYTLDFFFARPATRRLRLLAYVSARSPITVELVLVARQVAAPAPYGFGLSVEVPPIATIPGAPEASIESAYVTVGSADVAYYEQVHGRRTLVGLPGLQAPRRCPPGGFPTASAVALADGSTLTVKSAIPCPH